MYYICSAFHVPCVEMNKYFFTSIFLFEFFKNVYHFLFLVVYKFHRHPQYLELFVHLASTTLDKGHPERVIAWTNETLEWLTRQNELLLGKKTTTAFKEAVVPVSKSRPSGQTTLNTSEQCGTALSLVKPEQEGGTTKALLKSHSPPKGNKTLPPPHSQCPPNLAHNMTSLNCACECRKGCGKKATPFTCSGFGHQSYQG